MIKKLPISNLKSFILLLLLPLVLTGCTMSDLPLIGRFFGNANKPVTLTMWGLWEPKEVYEPVAQEYKTSHPLVTFEYDERSFVSLKSYKDSVLTRLKEGSAPDIVVLHNSWVPSIVDSLSPAPSKVLSAQAFDSKFYSAAKDAAVINDKVYAVPLGYDGLALLYNKELFKQEGISDPPATWEEFRIAAAKLTKKDGDNITQAGAAIGTADNIEHYSDIVGLLFAQGGIKVPQELDQQSAADALTFYTNFTTQEKVWSEALPSSVEAFASGKVAMVFAPSWQILNIVTANPQLDFAVAPVPKALDLSGQPIDVEWASFWMAAVSKNSANPDAAWEFLNHLTSESSQRALFSEQSKIRSFGVPYSNKALQSELAGNAMLDAYLKAAPNARSNRFAGKSGNDAEVGVLRDAINAVLQNTPASEALSEAKSKLTPK